MYALYKCYHSGPSCYYDEYLTVYKTREETLTEYNKTVSSFLANVDSEQLEEAADEFLEDYMYDQIEAGHDEQFSDEEIKQALIDSRDFRIEDKDGDFLAIKLFEDIEFGKVICLAP